MQPRKGAYIKRRGLPLHKGIGDIQTLFLAAKGEEETSVSTVPVNKRFFRKTINSTNK
jgi:hypothetical protein